MLWSCHLRRLHSLKQLGCFCWTEGRFEGGERKREGGGEGSGKEAERKETEKNKRKKMRGSTNKYLQKNGKDLREFLLNNHLQSRRGFSIIQDLHTESQWEYSDLALLSSMLGSKVTHLIENHNGIRRGCVPHMKDNEPLRLI